MYGSLIVLDKGWGLSRKSAEIGWNHVVEPDNNLTRFFLNACISNIYTAWLKLF